MWLWVTTAADDANENFPRNLTNETTFVGNSNPHVGNTVQPFPQKIKVGWIQ
jgi:hypothetical protein